MENKTTDINNLLYKMSQEEFSGYKFVDYWDADPTAIGFQKGNVLIYISTFNYTNTNHYDVIIEKLDTRTILKSEKERSYHELIDDIQSFLKEYFLQKT